MRISEGGNGPLHPSPGTLRSGQHRHTQEPPWNAAAKYIIERGLHIQDKQSPGAATDDGKEIGSGSGRRLMELITLFSLHLSCEPLFLPGPLSFGCGHYSVHITRAADWAAYILTPLLPSLFIYQPPPFLLYRL